MRSAQQVEDDDAFCRLIYRLRLPGQDDTEISIRAKTRTNERHDETSERGSEIVRQQIPNQMIFYVRSMSRWAVLTDRLPQIYVLEAKATQDYESSSGSLQGRLRHEGHKRYRHADGRYLAWPSGLPVKYKSITKSKHGIAFVKVGSNGSRGMRTAYAFRRGLTP